MDLLIKKNNTNNMDNILIIGSGKLGSLIAKQIKSDSILNNKNVNITGTTRNITPEKLDNFQKYFDEYRVIDTENIKDLTELCEGKSQIIVCVSPDIYNTIHYQRTYTNTALSLFHALTRLSHYPEILFISSTRVYLEKENSYVFEGDKLNFSDPYSYELLMAENILKGLDNKVVIARLGGLYGGSGYSNILDFYRSFDNTKKSCRDIKNLNFINVLDVARFASYFIFQVLSQGEYNLVDCSMENTLTITLMLKEKYGRPNIFWEDRIAAEKPFKGNQILNTKLAKTGFQLLYPYTVL